jgi:alkylhydroperoxidase family enzyme
MARIDGVSDQEASFIQRFIFRTAAKQAGAVPEPLRIMARSSGLMWAAGLFQTGFDRANRLEPKTKVLVSLKASSMIGCLFWLDINSAVGREHGITEEQLRDLTRYEESPAFSDLEKQILDYAVALSSTPANATDEQVARLRERLSDEQLVELTGMIAWENFRARFNRGFDVANQGYSQGAYCALPESHPAVTAIGADGGGSGSELG